MELVVTEFGRGDISLRDGGSGPLQAEPVDEEVFEGDVGPALDLDQGESRPFSRSAAVVTFSVKWRTTNGLWGGPRRYTYKNKRGVMTRGSTDYKWDDVSISWTLSLLLSRPRFGSWTRRECVRERNRSAEPRESPPLGPGDSDDKTKVGDASELFYKKVGIVRTTTVGLPILFIYTLPRPM